MIQTYKDGQRLIKKVFETLRDDFVEFNDNPEQAFSLVVDYIKKDPNFILGSFVRWDNQNKLEPVPVKASPIIINDSYYPIESFNQSPITTYENLKENEVFVSKLIHDAEIKHARMVQFMFYELSPSGNHHDCAVSVGGQPPKKWCNCVPLSDLSNTIGADPEGLTKYITLVKKYLPNNVIKCIFVYCPIIISDGRQPGNFFGLYQVHHTGTSAVLCPTKQLINQVSYIQAACSMIYSNWTAKDAMDKKSSEIRADIEKLLELKDDIARALDAIRNIDVAFNPYSIFPANSQIRKLQKDIKDKILPNNQTFDTVGYNLQFNKITTKHSVHEWQDDNRTWAKAIWLSHKENIINKLEILKSIQTEFLTFDQIDSTLPHERTKAGRYFKALGNHCIPIDWINRTQEGIQPEESATECVFTIPVKSDEDWPFLAPLIGLNAIIDKDHNPNIKSLVINNSLKITVTPDHRGLDGLKKLMSNINTSLKSKTYLSSRQDKVSTKISQNNTSKSIALVIASIIKNNEATLKIVDHNLEIDIPFELNPIM